MSKVEQNLELLFRNQAGKAKKIVMGSPRQGLDRSTAESAINKIVSTDIFDDSSGDTYATAEGARYVTRTVDDIYMVEA